MSDKNNGEISIYEQPGSAAIKAFGGMFDKVSEPSGEAYDRILEQIAAATDVDSLDSPWRSGSLGAMNGKEILVNGISKMPSDYDGGFGFFLLIDAIDKETGERVLLTTGAVAVVAQLVRANALDLFPVSFKVTVSEKPTKNGYHPIHLSVIR
jgi:hypothetical protein